MTGWLGFEHFSTTKVCHMPCTMPFAGQNNSWLSKLGSYFFTFIALRLVSQYDVANVVTCRLLEITYSSYLYW